MGRMLDAGVAQKSQYQGMSLNFSPVHVGMELFVEFQIKSRKEKLKTTLVGYSTGEFLVLKTPRVQGASISSSKGLNQMVVRYLLDGSVYGFQSTLLRMLGPPFYVTFISFPTRIEEKTLRRNPRIPVVIPCAWYGKEDNEGDGNDRIVNLSADGSLLHLNKSVVYGETINISFVLPDGEPVVDLKSTVRRVEVSSDRVLVGVEFDSDDEQLASIGNYLSVALTALGI